MWAVFIFECPSVLVDPSFKVHGLTKICLDFTIHLNIYLIDNIVRVACLAPFCDLAPSRESVKRACVSALLRVDGSLFYNV